MYIAKELARAPVIGTKRISPVTVTMAIRAKNATLTCAIQTLALCMEPAFESLTGAIAPVIQDGMVTRATKK